MGEKYSSYSLTSALDGVISVMPRPCFTPGKRTPGTHWIGDWVGLRAGQDTEAREKTLFASAGDRIPVFLSIVRHYSD
jgi:hypothetical protein